MSINTERDELVRLMEYDRTLFKNIMFGDSSNPMHYHIRNKSPEFHKEVDQELSLLVPGSKLAIVAPRDSAKTTLIDLIFPLHEILNGRLYFLLMISESENQSKLNLGTLGDEIEFNPKIREYYGNRMGPTWGKEEKDIICGYDKSGRPLICKVMVRGTEQKVRGLKFGPYRPSAIIDDGEGEANALTDLARAKFRRWLNASVIPGCYDGWLVFVGTIIDNESYLNRIAGSMAYGKDGNYKIKGWRSLFYQSVIQDTKPGEFVASGKEILENGIPKVLWPDRRPYQWLMDEKERLESEGDVQFWYSEHQNIPSDDSFRIFKKKDLRYWEGYFLREDGQNYIIRTDNGRREKIPVNTFIGSDPASSENVKADFTVHMPIHVDIEYNIYVDDYFRAQVAPMDGADALWEMMEKLHPKLTNIEETGHVMLADYILRKSKKTGRFWNIMPCKAIKTKYHRLMEMQPKFAAHAVFIKEGHTELESEYLNFRKTGTFKKDTLDALKWAMENIFAPNLEKKDGEWIMPVSPTGNDWQTGEPLYEDIAPVDIGKGYPWAVS